MIGRGRPSFSGSKFQAEFSKHCWSANICLPAWLGLNGNHWDLNFHPLLKRVWTEDYKRLCGGSVCGCLLLPSSKLLGEKKNKTAVEWASSAICFSPIIPPHCLCVPLGRNPGEEMAGNHRQILELLGAGSRQEKDNKNCKMPARSQLLPWGWSEEAGLPPWRLRHLKLIVSILCRHSTWNERKT